jgi:hypothetical protein
MKLIVFIVPLFTLDACQNPSRLQAAPSGPFVDSNGPQRAEHLGLDIPPISLLGRADEVIE